MRNVLAGRSLDTATDLGGLSPMHLRALAIPAATIACLLVGLSGQGSSNADSNGTPEQSRLTVQLDESGPLTFW